MDANTFSPDLVERFVADKWDEEIVPRQVEYQSRVVLAAFELAHRHASARSRSGESGWNAGATVPMHRE